MHFQSPKVNDWRLSSEALGKSCGTKLLSSAPVMLLQKFGRLSEHKKSSQPTQDILQVQLYLEKHVKTPPWGSRFALLCFWLCTASPRATGSHGWGAGSPGTPRQCPHFLWLRTSTTSCTRPTRRFLRHLQKIPQLCQLHRAAKEKKKRHIWGQQVPEEEEEQTCWYEDVPLLREVCFGWQHRMPACCTRWAATAVPCSPESSAAWMSELIPPVNHIKACGWAQGSLRHSGL